MRLIGYARVSREFQNLDSQLDALTFSGCQLIFTDKMSGARNDRPELQKALDACEKGDVLVVFKLDRLGRSLQHLIKIIDELNAKGVGFKTCVDGIDTTSTSGKLIFHIFGALAEFERSTIIQRTKAGLEAARARGRIGGRKEKLSQRQAVMARQLLNEGHTAAEVCTTLGIARSTLYRSLKKHLTTEPETAQV